jgi:hypothetical protein
MPMSGEYGLEIFGSFPNQPETMYTHVCQYLIVCTRRDDDHNEALLQQYLRSLDSRNVECFEKISARHVSFDLFEILGLDYGCLTLLMKFYPALVPFEQSYYNCCTVFVIYSHRPQYSFSGTPFTCFIR